MRINPPPCHRRSRRPWALRAAAVVAWILAAFSPLSGEAAARADEPADDRQIEAAEVPPADRGAVGRDLPVAVIPLRLPITGTRDTQVEGAILRQLDRLGSRPGQRGILVLVFEGADEPGAAGSDFGRSLELARFLGDQRLSGVKTVAWLPGGARGHAVLVALACEEIVLPPDAVFGPANAGEPTVDDTMRAAYTQAAARRRTAPPALALALLDPQTRAVRVSTDDGDQIVAAGDLPLLRERSAVLEEEELGPAPLALDGRRARALGLARLLARSPAELARGLGLREGSLVVDPTLDGGWKGVQVVISGGISADTVARTQSRIEEAIAAGKNFVCLRIDSPGGEPEQSLVLAGWLAGLDPSRVKTVAWVPREARGDAALVATACDDLVMGPEAILGGEGAAAIGQRQAGAIAVAWREGVARKRDRSWSLPVALVSPGLVVRQATRGATGRVDHFCDEEFDQLKDRDAWQRGAEVGVGPIVLNGRSAEALGLASHVVDGFDGLARAYGLEGDVALAAPGWADTLLDALASPGIAWLLLLIGGAGLYIELHTPGVGLGGFVAMVAFIVYFWSQHLHGTSGWLEVMLFLAGLFCLAAEIFVLPGFGVLGLGGGLLMVASLVLASQSFVLPTNAYQLRQLQWSLLGILGAAGGVTTLAIVGRRWLPESRLFRHVLLAPPVSTETNDDEDPLNALIGVEGETTTRLAPAGKARIGGVLHDVTSDGFLVEPGSTVEVTAVRGGRLVVRASLTTTPTPTPSPSTTSPPGARG
jgi:membrane-bound serine protease (ClpP class)